MLTDRQRSTSCGPAAVRPDPDADPDGDARWWLHGHRSYRRERSDKWLIECSATVSPAPVRRPRYARVPLGLGPVLLRFVHVHQYHCLPSVRDGRTRTNDLRRQEFIFIRAYW